MLIQERIKEYMELVKFEHTIFALPFALSAMLLACPVNVWPTLNQVALVLGAMVGGRTFAMGLNRLIDHEIDGKNPRTQNRSIPAGRVKLFEAGLLTLLAAALFAASVWYLPEICWQLLPVAFAILILYSYVKRFSSLAHLVLGIALGSSAVGGWLAISGELTWLPVIFGFAVVFWVSGFDIIYACQDEAFDRTAGLHSIPVALGAKNALMLSRLFHGLCVGLLILFGLTYAQTGFFYWLAVAIVAGMLIYEHRLVKHDDLSRVNEAFFAVNGQISLTVFALVLLDKLF